jgi:hypothetical protein
MMCPLIEISKLFFGKKEKKNPVKKDPVIAVMTSTWNMKKMSIEKLIGAGEEGD